MNAIDYWPNFSGVLGADSKGHFEKYAHIQNEYCYVPMTGFGIRLNIETKEIQIGYIKPLGNPIIWNGVSSVEVTGWYTEWKENE